MNLNVMKYLSAEEGVDRLAALARSVDDEVLALADEPGHLRQPRHCREHVMLGGEVRPANVEVAFHAAIIAKIRPAVPPPATDIILHRRFQK